VLQDWNSGKIPFFVLPPDEEEEEAAGGMDVDDSASAATGASARVRGSKSARGAGTSAAAAAAGSAPATRSADDLGAAAIVTEWAKVSRPALVLELPFVAAAVTHLRYCSGPPSKHTHKSATGPCAGHSCPRAYTMACSC
jgi:hypothetical protein